MGERSETKLLPNPHTAAEARFVDKEVVDMSAGRPLSDGQSAARLGRWTARS